MTGNTFKSGTAGVARKNTAGRRAVKVIEWYFYPEFAPKKYFKNKKQHVERNLKIVTGSRYEELSQKSDAWSHSSRPLMQQPGSNMASNNKQRHLVESSSRRSSGANSNMFTYLSTPTQSIRSEAIHHDLHQRGEASAYDRAPKMERSFRFTPD